MDVPLLRTLSWKSILGFGKYRELSVRQIYDLQHTQYLRWIYYCMEGITFSDEILETLGIREKIEKPGTDPEQHEAINEKIIRSMKRTLYPKALKARLTLGGRIAIKKTVMYEKKYYSKGAMQARNQGH